MIDEALNMYALAHPECTLIRHNENETYHITDDAGEYVLRIHRPTPDFSLGLLRQGKRAIPLLQGELDMLGRLSSAGMNVQEPVLNKHGERLTLLSDGTPVTVLKWIAGDTIADIGYDATKAQALGVQIARIHAALNYCEPSFKPVRYNYDEKLASAMQAELKTAQAANTFTAAQYAACECALIEIARQLGTIRMEPGQFGLVHSDLNTGNIIWSNGEIVPIDYSLAGYSGLDMDIGSALASTEDDSIRSMILAGYEAEAGRSINIERVEAFFAWQVLLFIACQHSRARGRDWFADAMERWCETLFIPLAEHKRFLLGMRA